MRVREYLTMDAEVREFAPSADEPSISPLEILENTFYRFDEEAVMACLHAVEDLAFEEASGTLLTCCQDFKNFESELERYSQLAATIDRVEVVGTGRAPRARDGVRYSSLPRHVLKDFRVALFEGRHHDVLFMARESNDSRNGSGPHYTGFYSLSPEVIERVCADIQKSRSEKGRGLTEFRRLEVIDRAAKQINVEFARERDLVGAAIGKLQTSCDRYNVHNFTRDLRKSLDHLDQWKTRLPQMLEEADCR